MTEELSRTEFDEVVKSVFPTAHKTRQEQSFGWVDTIDLNMLVIRIQMYTEDIRNMKRNQVMVELHAVRKTIDGSTVLLWHERKTSSKLKDTLQNLRRRLFGMAAAILMLCDTEDCGQDEPWEKPRESFSQIEEFLKRSDDHPGLP